MASENDIHFVFVCWCWSKEFKSDLQRLHTCNIIVCRLVSLLYIRVVVLKENNLEEQTVEAYWHDRRQMAEMPRTGVG